MWLSRDQPAASAWIWWTRGRRSACWWRSAADLHCSSEQPERYDHLQEWLHEAEERRTLLLWLWRRRVFLSSLGQCRSRLRASWTSPAPLPQREQIDPRAKPRSWYQWSSGVFCCLEKFTQWKCGCCLVPSFSVLSTTHCSSVSSHISTRALLHVMYAISAAFSVHVGACARSLCMTIISRGNARLLLRFGVRLHDSGARSLRKHNVLETSSPCGRRF